MRAHLSLLTALSLSLLTACSARTFTTSEETVEAGSVTRLTVDVRATVNRQENRAVTPMLCVAVDAAWPAPTVTYTREGGAVQTPSSSEWGVEEAQAYRAVSAEGLSWHCFQVSAGQRAAPDAGPIETAKVFVDLLVPDDAEGLYPIRTLGRWSTQIPLEQFDEAEHVLRVQRPPTDTFDVWKGPSWGRSAAGQRLVSYGDRFVSIESDGMAWSHDGEVWKAVSDMPALSSLTYGNGVWVGITVFEGHLGVHAFDAPAPGWRTTFPSSVPVNEVVFGHGLFVARGADGLLLTSPDGVNWTARDSHATELWAVAASDAGFLAAGPAGVLRSTDGLTWTVTPADHDWQVRQPVYGNGRWLAVAAPLDNAAAGFLVESTDDWATWQKVRSLPRWFDSTLRSLWFVDGRFVASSGDGPVYGSGSSGWAPLLTGYSGRLGGFAQNEERVVVTGDFGFSARAERRVPAALRFVTSGWKVAGVEVPYVEPVVVSGGKGAVTIEVAAGELPPGLSLKGDVIAGTPTATGTFEFSLRATDAAGATLTVPFSLEVKDPPRLPEVEERYVPVGEMTELRFPITGGTAPFQVIASGASETATVDGSDVVVLVQIDEINRADLFLTVTDQAGLSVTRGYVIYGLGDTPRISGGNANPIHVGTEWVAVYILEGWTPATWVVEGTLPEGIEPVENESQFVLRGIHRGEVEAEYPITLKATDPLGQTAELQTTLRVVMPPRLSVEVLPSAIVDEAYAFRVQATGGEAPITWHIEGALPAGLSWTQTEGGRTLSGTATVKGLFPQKITLSDARNIQTEVELPFGVGERPTLVQPTPARAVVGQAYALTFAVTGGESPYRFDVAGELPPGLATTQDNGTFVVKGIPTQEGWYAFTVSITDAYRVVTAFKEVRVQVVTEPRLLARTLPAAVVDVPYQEVLQIVGGSFPFTCSLQGALPPGLSLVPSGTTCMFTGKATVAGAFSFSVTVTDAYQLWSTQSFELSSVVSPPPVVVVPALPVAVLDQRYEATFEVTGGQGPMTFHHSGTLPEGLGFSATDDSYQLTGSPTTAGTFSFAVGVKDVYGFQGATDLLTIEVVTRPEVVTQTLVDGKVGTAYLARLEATDGTAPYTWSNGGGLPEGLTFSEQDGAYVLSGTPTRAGAFTFTAKVTDAHALDDSRVFTLTIAPGDVDEQPRFVEEPRTEGCGGCDATSASSLLALAGLGFLGRRRRR